MNQDFVDVLANVSVAGKISGGDVLRLREALWTEEALPQSALEALFDLNRRCEDIAPEWADLLLEALDHFLLHQTAPFGFLDENGAAWLRAQLDRAGRVHGWLEMELLVSILESAENTPDWFKAWTLSQIEETIVTGVGPTRDPAHVSPNYIDEAEVDLIRRIIFSSGGEGAEIVGTHEADMLFRLKDRTLHSENAPGWQSLFVQGVGNHLMAHSDYRQMSPQEAKRLNGFMNEHTPNLAGFFARMLPREMFGNGTIAQAFKAVFDTDEGEHFGNEGDMDASRELTMEEAGWLKTHIAADEHTDELEKLLLTFVLEEAGNLPAVLDSVRRRA